MTSIYTSQIHNYAARDWYSSTETRPGVELGLGLLRSTGAKEDCSHSTCAGKRDGRQGVAQGDADEGGTGAGERTEVLLRVKATSECVEPSAGAAVAADTAAVATSRRERMAMMHGRCRVGSESRECGPTNYGFIMYTQVRMTKPTSTNYGFIISTRRHLIFTLWTS